jgi:hypothetical protein
MSSPDFRKGPKKDKQSKVGIVTKEVKNLLKTGKRSISSRDIMRLNRDYDGDVVDQIREKFIDTHREIRKKAKKFAHLINQKYGQRNYPLHKLLKQARKYKDKYNLSDEEFEEFRRVYEQQLMGVDNKREKSAALYPRTAIGKTLGHEAHGESFKAGEDDYESLQQLLQMYAGSRPLHAQITLQAMTYQDVAPEAVVGTFDQTKNNPHQHVHPVLAAMFIPRFTLFDEHILMSNIAYIVATKHNGEPIRTRPDYQLYYDLISDPNDIVCDKHSPVKDLLRRADLQHAIWNNVLNLRTGRYYGEWATQFLLTIDNCKIATYDVPDLMYAGDAGTVMKRILSAFSIRPTIVATTPLYNIVPEAPYAGTLPSPKVTSLPYVTLRLPYTTNDSEPVHLNDALEQPQWFLEGGKILPKNQSIIYSRGVLIFYVNRRMNSINVGKLTEPYNFNRLPITIAGVERINTRPVHFDHHITVRDETFFLRSVVGIDTSDRLEDTAIGSFAMFSKDISTTGLVNNEELYYYNPRRAAEVYDDGASMSRSAPVTKIDRSAGLYDNNSITFDNYCRKYGSVFIYQSTRATEARNYGEQGVFINWGN